MPTREVPDRRGRSERGGTGLLERDTPLQAIETVCEDARRGVGLALLIEGHAGLGKTRLYEAALDHARTNGMRTLRAAGAELEQTIAFGLARQLLHAQLAELDDREAQRLLGSAPETLRAMAGLNGEGSTAAPGELAFSHGLFTLIADAAEGHPALIAIDDLHWADVASLEFLLYALHRLAELPVGIVMTRRPDVGLGAGDILDRIATHPRVRVERLSALGGPAVAEITRRMLGEHSPEVSEACLRASAGNPFYVRELLLALAEEGHLPSADLARRALDLAPDAVIRTVRVRVGRLGRDAAAVSRAVAILGDDVPLRQAAALAGVSLADAARAADSLARVEVLLAREPLRFVHPLVAQAVVDDIPGSERVGRHLEAARLLEAEGADLERVAAHLLVGRCEGNPHVVEQLRAAAAEALSRGAPQSAVAYLLRALDEPPGIELRAEVLAELGVAEAAAGLPTAAERFARAAAATDDPHRRAELALERGRSLLAQGRHEQAAHAYEEGLATFSKPPSRPEARELFDQLEVGFVSTASLVPALQPRALEQAQRVLRRMPQRPSTQGQRLLLAEAALQRSFSGDPADTVRDLAERAWDGGAVLEHAAPQWIGWRMAANALCLSGHLERAVEVAEAAKTDARRRAAPLDFATASFVASLPRLWQGAVREALADLEGARDARRYGWRQFVRAATAQYALCLLEHGEADRADQTLHEEAPEGQRDLEDTIWLYALAEVRLAQGQVEEAYELARRTGELVEQHVEFFGLCPWRTVAAPAALAMGDRTQALTLAREAAERAVRIGVLHQRIRTQRVLGICEDTSRGLKALRSAVQIGTSSPPRLETIRALVDLGARLRRTNQRAAAREPLEQAVDMAWRGGAMLLYERARTELAAAGARPRREALLSGAASLTPSERRIAELAALGSSNREIAQTLFVTPKTVEYHLRNAYRKLDVSGRSGLSDALAA